MRLFAMDAGFWLGFVVGDVVCLRRRMLLSKAGVVDWYSLEP